MAKIVSKMKVKLTGKEAKQFTKAIGDADVRIEVEHWGGSGKSYELHLKVTGWSNKKSASR